MSNSKLVLVTGATGQQGGALAQRLLAHGHHVRALTRRPDAEAAHTLASRGAEIVRGDFDDPASLEKAAQDVDAVFAMSAFWEQGTDAETKQGMAVVDAAAAAGVGHFVHTSVASAHRNTGVPHFDSKFRIEQHLSGSGLDYTIIRPVYFMENAIAFSAAAIAQGKLPIAMPPDTPLQQVSLADVGKFAALAIEEPGRFIGQAIDIAGDELTGAETARLIGDAAGISVTYEQIPLEAMRAASEDLGAMYDYFERVGLSADVDALRRDYPEVGWQRLADWAAAQDWRAIVEGAA